TIDTSRVLTRKHLMTYNAIKDKSESLNKETQILYLHKYLYGGGTTFTAHLFHQTRYLTKKNSAILRTTKRTESKLRDFGYGLQYQNISLNLINKIKFPLIALFKQTYLNVLTELNKRKDKSDNNDILVIHDHRDISDNVVPHLRNWQLVTIRRTVQNYLKAEYDLSSLFLYHPFYPYPTVSDRFERKGAVSISRISFEKNIDIMIKANKILQDNPIKLFGCPSRMYVHLYLGGKKGDFNKYYHGIFEKSFSTLSNILAQARFVVDLSVLKYDGGGTQYTFLEAIHNGCALILHRKWLENAYVNPNYCDFKEGYNCFAIDNENELAEIIRKDPDTSKIVKNAKKLMIRHIKSDWSSLLRSRVSKAV
ncbi:MAG: glycosyltransferase, partial [Thermoproteota archaeon]|nr:glycosyltransferase [Thermoproteota archaeon]